MTRTLKVLIGAAALAIIGVSTASAQTGPLLGRELYLFDGGSGTTQNTVRLIAPPADTITSSWTFMLPKNPGGTNFILVNTDGAGKTEWQDGLTIFWGIDGNCDPITPWNGTTGNYIGHCSDDIDFHSGNDHMNFWFNDQTTPRLVLDSNGRMILNVIDGSEGLVIYGNGPTGPDAGIVLDCAYPPTVGMEVNALATGILMPTCATAPFVGISLKAQTTGIEIDDTPTALYITDATTGIDAEGAIYFRDLALDATDTRLVSVDATTGQLSYRTVASTGTIVTTPAPGGTVNTLPLWTPSGTELGNSIITQDGGATTATINGAAVVTGQSDLRGNLINTTGDLTLLDGNINVNATGAGTVAIGSAAAGNVTVASGATTQIAGPDIYLNPTAADDLRINTNLANDETDTRILTQDATTGVISYRAISGTGTVVTGTGTPNRQTRWTGAGTLGDAQITDDGSGDMVLLNDINAGNFTIQNIGAAGTDFSGTGGLTLADNLTVTAGGASITGTTSINTSGAATTSIGSVAAGAINVFSGANIALNSTSGDITLAATDVAINSSTGVTINTVLNAPTTIGTSNVASVTSIASPTIDISNVPTVATATSLLRRNATGDIEVSSASFAVIPGGTLPINRNVRTDGAGGLTVGAIALNGGSDEVTGVLPIANGGTNSGTALNNNRIMVSSGGAIVEANALSNGQILIGSTGGAPTPGTISSSGSTVTITNGAGSINLEVANPLPVPAVGNTNWTLRSNGTAWVASGALQNNGTDVTATGGLAVNGSTTLGNDDADAHVIRGIFGVNAIPGQAGSITIGNSAAGTTNLNSSTINAPNLPSTGVNTDEFVVTDGTTLRTATVATMIGGIPWVIGGNSTAPASGIIGITVASTQDLQFYVNNAQAISIDDATLLTTINNDLTVAENTTLGDNAGDITSIVGNLNVNSAFATAQAVNVNTAAAAHTFTLGNSFAGNNTTLNSATITVPNIPAAAAATTLIVRDGSNNLGTRTIGSGTNIITGSGTNNTLTKWTSANTIGDGSITDDGTTVEFSTAAVEMPNLPNDPSASNWIVTYNNTTGALEKKDLGTPVQKTKTAQGTIAGTGAVRVFTISDVFVTANSIITVTLQDGGGNPDVNDYSITVLNVAAGQFDVRLSGFMANTATKLVNYTITNP